MATFFCRPLHDHPPYRHSTATPPPSTATLRPLASTSIKNVQPLYDHLSYYPYSHFMTAFNLFLYYFYIIIYNEMKQKVSTYKSTHKQYHYNTSSYWGGIVLLHSTHILTPINSIRSAVKSFLSSNVLRETRSSWWHSFGSRSASILTLLVDLRPYSDVVARPDVHCSYSYHRSILGTAQMYTHEENIAR